MTGLELYKAVMAETSLVRDFPVSLVPSMVRGLANSVMREMNTYVTVYAAKYKFRTFDGYRFYRLTSGGVGINPLGIVRASIAGKALYDRRQTAFPGAALSTEDVTITERLPRRIWLEENPATGVTAIGLDPIPDVGDGSTTGYIVRVLVKLPVPEMTDDGSELPVRLEAHETVVAGVTARLFDLVQDFHYNDIKRDRRARYERMMAELGDWEAKSAVEPSVRHTTRRFTRQM